jgi:hypothetical protein
MEATPGKGYTVMDIYGALYTEEEKKAHMQAQGGAREVFSQMQKWINDFREQGYVTSKMVSTSIFFSAVE